MMPQAAPSATDPALRVDDLSLVINDARKPISAVNDISFSVDPGETLALVGESGCGKSLTALALMGLLPDAIRVSTGSITLHGSDITTLSERELQKRRGDNISMIFQDPMTTLNPLVTIGNQITETLRIHRKIDRGTARERAKALLERVGVSDAERRLDQFPHELSGGMRQRVMIASAMICDPDVIVADEPTTALDVTVQAQVLALLQELQREAGMALILVTHDFGVVAQTADKVAVMYAGRIVEQGPADAIFAAPKHPYTEALLECSAPPPPIDGRARDRSALPQIDGTVMPLTQQFPGCRFAPRCAFATERCRTEVPRTRGNRHTVACHHPRQDLDTGVGS